MRHSWPREHVFIKCRSAATAGRMILLWEVAIFITSPRRTERLVIRAGLLSEADLYGSENGASGWQRETPSPSENL